MKHNQDYYLALPISDSSRYRLSPTKETLARHYKFKEQFAEDGPLVFESISGNTNSDENRILQDVLFDGLSLLIRERYVDTLSQFLPDGCKFVPAEFKDGKGNQHAGYQLLNIFTTLDCLDADNSVILDEDEDGYYEVKKYSLSQNVLDSTAEKDRLIIKIARINMPYTIFHKSVVKVFEDNQIDGIRFFNLTDFEEGDQYL